MRVSLALVALLSSWAIFFYKEEMMAWNAPQFCRDYSIPYLVHGSSPKVSSGWIGIQCPNPSCQRNTLPDYGGFNLSAGRYVCWNCGGHNLIKVIRWLLHINNYEAQQLVWDYSGAATVLGSLNHKKIAGKVSKVDIPGGPLLNKHWNYLESRGLDPEFLSEKYHLLGVGGKPKTQLEKEYKNRVIIPIHDKSNRLISFQGRDVTGEARLRYKGCKIEESVMNYKHGLYGWEYANSAQVALVEGVVDKWVMGDGFLCSYGTAMTEQQIRELTYFDRIFFLFDPEKNALALARKHAAKLAALNKEVEVIKMDEGFDPGELPEKDVKYIRRELGFI